MDTLKQDRCGASAVVEHGRTSGGRRWRAIAVIAGSMLWLTASSSAFSAFEFHIDQFTVTRVNGGVPVPLVNDTFADGILPPKGPDGITDVYLIAGSPWPAASESGGKLALTSDGAALAVDADGRLLLTQRARFATDTTLGGNAGLRDDGVFSVRGIFDLDAPTAIWQGYGIKLTDTTLGNAGDDTLELLVRRNEASQVVVQLARSDFAGGTWTVLEEHAVDSGRGDQIQLLLAKLNSTSRAVNASFIYLSAGSPVGAATVFSSAPLIFNGEDYTRAEFKATEAAAVPEPGAVLLLAVGLSMLAGAARLGSRRQGART
jgi:hypothetical protein